MRCILLIDCEVVKIQERCDFCFVPKARCSSSFFKKYIASADQSTVKMEFTVGGSLISDACFLY